MSKLVKILIMFGTLSTLALSGCRTSWNDGYDAGIGDAAKRQYQLIQSLNDAEHYGAKEENYNIKTYKFPAPTEVNGIKYRPHKLEVRAYE